MACRLRGEALYFVVGEDARGFFGGVEDAIHDGVVGGDFVALQPEQDVGFAAHRADFDDLVEAEEMQGDAAIDDVGEFGIFAVESFHDRGGVDAGGGAEGVVADNRVVRRDGGVCGAGDVFAIFLEAGEVAIDQTHQAEVDQHEFHRACCPRARPAELAAAWTWCGPGGDGGERISDGQAAVVVAVPVDADFFAAGLHDFIDSELDEVVGALRRGVADGIAEDDSAGAVADRGGVETS